jgi:Ca-activated chloride channel family protein
MSSREQADEIHFKAAYNLGNTAFKKGDFESAAAHYKQAILKNPENSDAKYNLELALRELEKTKENKSPEGGSSPQKDTHQPGDKGDQSNTGEKEQGQDKQSQAQDQQRNEKEKAASDEQETSRQPKATGKDEVEKDEPDSSKDLSGALDSLSDMPEQKQDDSLNQSGLLLDRKKAEALLDNLKEDRSRFLRFQIPEDKKHGVQSGKDW